MNESGLSGHNIRYTYVHPRPPTMGTDLININYCELISPHNETNKVIGGVRIEYSEVFVQAHYENRQGRRPVVISIIKTTLI